MPRPATNLTLAPQAATALVRSPSGPVRPAASRPGRRPSLRVERALLREGITRIAGMDEVGRGALAGPVTVGVVIVDASTRSAPTGLRDSKLLTAAERDALAPRLRRWAGSWAVGHAEPDEIDRYGIIAALRLAGTRALAQLGAHPDIVVLDGNHDWLTPPAPTLFDDAVLSGAGVRRTPPLPGLVAPLPAVRTMIKADLRCSAVAAASVLAKTSRDAIMVELGRADDRFDWESNKGYSAPAHQAGLRRWGPTTLHRRTWRLPGTAEGQEGEIV